MHHVPSLSGEWFWGEGRGLILAAKNTKITLQTIQPVLLVEAAGTNFVEPQSTLRIPYMFTQP